MGLDAVYAENLDELSDEGDYEAGEEEEDEDGIEEEEGEGEEDGAQPPEGKDFPLILHIFISLHYHYTFMTFIEYTLYTIWNGKYYEVHVPALFDLSIMAWIKQNFIFIITQLSLNKIKALAFIEYNQLKYCWTA